MVAVLCGSALLARGQAFINDFSPKAGMPGDTIQVIGSGFAPGTTRLYFWNGIQAVATVTSSTMLTAVMPAGATTGVLGVQIGAGQPVYTSAKFTVIGAGPYIADVTPAYGDSNTLVTISGVHLTNVALNGVKFNGAVSTDAYANGTGMQITVHVPRAAPIGPGPLTVTTIYGTSNSPSPFTVLGPGPYVAVFDPDHGTANLQISIMGTHLATVTNVLFNGLPGLGLYASDTLITVTTPNGVTTGPLIVNSAQGSFTTASNFFVPPTLTSFTPASGRAGTNVTLIGTNFRGATNVNFNGKAATFSIINNTNIQATVPSGATSGLIQVMTPDFSCVSTGIFKVLPTIYGFTPVFGRPGTNVVIMGANFNVGTPSVWFNGVKAQTVSGVSFGQLTAVVPAGATTTGPISIGTTDGTHTNINPFYLPASITGFAPSSGLPGTPVTISGLNFLGTSALSFGGIPAPFTVSGNSSITAFVPNNVISGRIALTAPAGDATSSTSFYGAPQIVSFTPTSGLPGTNVTIIGTNFLDATAVRFNGLSANFSYVNNGKIVAVVPAGAQTGSVSIEAPGGTNITVANFLVDYQSNLETWITDAPDPVTATSNLVYTTTVVNRGPFDAPHVRLTNTLPSSVTLVNANISWPWLLATNDNQLVATIDNLAVGAASTLSVTVVPQTPGMLVAGSSVTSDYRDPIPGNNSVAITTTVDPLPLLSIRWWTNQVKVSWHSGLTNFALESVPSSPTNSAWAAVTNIPVIVGSQKSVILSNTGPSTFFRLKK